MRRGPREAASWRRAAVRVVSTGPRLPPSASATATPSFLLVGFLLFLLFAEVRAELRLDELVLADRDRLLLFDVESLGDLRLAAAARRLAGGRRFRLPAVLLVGAALRAEGLALA